MDRTREFLRVVVAFIMALMWTTATVSSQSNYPPERFTAFAVSLGDIVTPSGTATVDINVTRWSSDAELKMLVATLTKKGPEALLEALRDSKSVGTIRTPDSLGYDLRYAHQESTPEGGRRIFIATDRPISFWEAVNRPRSFDYPFTVIEIVMPREGAGEGKLSLAAKIWANRGIISLENYGTAPVHLKEVRSVQRTR